MGPAMRSSKGTRLSSLAMFNGFVKNGLVVDQHCITRSTTIRD